MRARISSCEFPSDSSLLVEACVARVRELARLDEDVVLPPLPRVAPRRDVVILTKMDAAGRAAGWPASESPVASAGDALGASVELVVERVSPRSALPGRTSRGALTACALVAVGFGCAAFLASPAGHEPKVVRAVSIARAYASDAAHSAVEAASAITH